MPDRIASTAFLLAVFAALVTHGCVKAHHDERARQLAARVRTEFLHAWNNYERYAWGHDALRPLSKTPHDWYGQSLLMTPVDALDTLVLMHLDAEAMRTRSLIVSDLSFDRDIYVKNFEITIRLLGGLLSGYQLTGDKRLLNLAEDLGNRLLPVFNSSTGLPYIYVNLRTGETRGAVTNPAETGTLLLEFGTLSKLTSRAVFYEKAKRALVVRRSASWGKALMSRQARGRTLTVTSAAALTRTTSIFGNAGFFSATKIVAICGTPAFPPLTNILPMKSAANCGTATLTCEPVSAPRRLTARLMLSSLRCSPFQAISRERVACKLPRSKCRTCTALSRKFLITKRCTWLPEVIICAPRSSSPL